VRLRAVLAICSVLLAQAYAFANELLLAQNNKLLAHIEAVHGYDTKQMSALRDLFLRSGYMGQGNPAITEHADSISACEAHSATQNYANSDFERICGGKFMAPLYDPAHATAAQALTCIDQFEFPNIPCEYPVVWTKASEAAQVCATLGKRLCDAHEWEGACEGALEEPDYDFNLASGVDEGAAVARMRAAHNTRFAASARWSYGREYQRGVCAAASRKSAGCNGGSWQDCGSNTYPAGDFPQCVSPLGVYDLNGNAAEHMNLPLNISQMTSRGSTTLGVTEMKGSWFIFDSYRAHPDWCRWRAPYWHGSRVLDAHSHANYHLGFRCCKTLPRAASSSSVNPTAH
jgi:formylglycine-generating enzyme required for sulfatase activity